jgi:ketosteroid isomerase-like protein
MNPLPDDILFLAKNLDTALEERRTEEAVECFSPDCTIELPGITVHGLEGVHWWVTWLSGAFSSIRFTPVTVISMGGTYVEEYLLTGVFIDGREVVSRQAEVLEFSHGKIISMRLYFDPLEFAEVEGGLIGLFTIHEIRKRILKGLEQNYFTGHDFPVITAHKKNISTRFF